eukprot:75001-Pelagomonas_calceolata.AAC.4
MALPVPFGARHLCKPALVVPSKYTHFFPKSSPSSRPVTRAQAAAEVAEAVGGITALTIVIQDLPAAGSVDVLYEAGQRANDIGLCGRAGANEHSAREVSEDEQASKDTTDEARERMR